MVAWRNIPDLLDTLVRITNKFLGGLQSCDYGSADGGDWSCPSRRATTREKLDSNIKSLD